MIDDVQLIFIAIPTTIVLAIFGIQLAGALVVSPTRRGTYWRIVRFAHLPFLVALVALIPGASQWWPWVGLALWVGLAFAGAVASGLVVRRTGWTRAGPIGLLYTLANSFSVRFVSAFMTGHFAD